MEARSLELEEVEGVFDELTRKLERNYRPGFGIMPSSETFDNFYGQLWARDMALAAASYYIRAEPAAVLDSLNTFFKHQTADGLLPYMVEREYSLAHIVPGFWRLAGPLFTLIEGKFRKRTERPLYEGSGRDGAEDTIPALVIAAGMLLRTPIGRSHASAYVPHLERALERFARKTDPHDALAVVTSRNPDWTESVQRTGKLGYVNVLWVESLFVMREIYRGLGNESKALLYASEYERAKRSLLSVLYDRQEAYFRTKVGEERLDTVASILGALFFLDAVEAVRVAETIESRVRVPTGLRNFAPQYRPRNIHQLNRLFGTSGYHNEFTWPWVACQNILLKIKIAKEHPDESVRERYKLDAVSELGRMAKLFRVAGGAYEILCADTEQPPVNPLYKPPQDFLASMAAFAGAYANVKALGWI